jgi:hypothetical protein
MVFEPLIKLAEAQLLVWSAGKSAFLAPFVAKVPYSAFAFIFFHL